MNNIIKVSPVPEYYSITWMLGSLCNYDCMYCNADWHDSTSRPHDLETLQSVWNNIYQQTKHHGLAYKIAFTGGEITANKSFLPLLRWLRKSDFNIDMILITTNGSASLGYYKKIAELVESIGFSTHSEFMDEADFFHKVREINRIMIRPKKSVHVAIMDEPWHQTRIKVYEDFCHRHDISYSRNKINMIHRIRDNNIPIPEPTLERLD